MKFIIYCKLLSLKSNNLKKYIIGKTEQSNFTLVFLTIIKYYPCGISSKLGCNLKKAGQELSEYACAKERPFDIHWGGRGDFAEY